MKQSSVIKISLAALAFCSSMQLFAADDAPKSAILDSYKVIYNQQPTTVNSFTDMFKDGNFYGRLRSNTFLFNYSKQTSKDTLASGLGGSLVYQSGIYDNFDFRAGIYYSHGFIDDASKTTVANLKGASDVINRPYYYSNGTQDLYALGQAYLRYTGIKKSEVIVGRQLIDTFFTASNDTKMIPEAFDGVVFNSSTLSKTKITFAYLADEKMRGHTDTNSVLAYDSSTTTNATNDDSAMAKGLTTAKLMSHGINDAPLLIAEAHNTSIENLKLDASGYNVPQLVGQAMVEGNYKFGINKDFSITPGVRYLHQFDEGAGDIGGAALSGSLAGKTGNLYGYKDASSMNSNMVAARLVAKYKNYELNFGYSQVFDEADLVDPWRAFPTAGYTRSMARYNWFADSRSYRVQLSINTNATGVYKNIFIQTSALHTDNDASKGLPSENYYYVGLIQNLPSMPQFQWRLRVGYDDILTNTTSGKQVVTGLAANDNLDTRLEFNYLF